VPVSSDVEGPLWSACYWGYPEVVALLLHALGPSTPVSAAHLTAALNAGELCQSIDRVAEERGTCTARRRQGKSQHTLCFVFPSFTPRLMPYPPSSARLTHPASALCCMWCTAARRGHVSVLEQLLAYGADPRMASAQGRTPLHAAAVGTCLSTSYLHMLERERERMLGAALGLWGRRTPLHAAAVGTCNVQHPISTCHMCSRSSVRSSSYTCTTRDSISREVLERDVCERYCDEDKPRVVWSGLAWAGLPPSMPAHPSLATNRPFFCLFVTDQVGMRRCFAVCCSTPRLPRSSPPRMHADARPAPSPRYVSQDRHTAMHQS
jgi:hypothetical protein